MRIQNTDIVDDATIVPTTLALIDSPEIELRVSQENHVLVDDPEFFDPMGLYALECERDEACTTLADAFPGATISLHHDKSSISIDGKWQSSSQWSVLVQKTEGDYHASATTPADAVKAVIKAHRKATAPVRTTPQCLPIIATSFESLGRINFSDAREFMAMLQDRLGITSDITVESDGRVFLDSGHICGSEAQDIGNAIAEFNMTPERMADETAIQVIVEPRGSTFKAFIVLPTGERVEVAGVSPTESAAKKWAQAAIMARRSTLPAVAAIASESTAA